MLHLFAFGTYKDWKQNESKLPELTPTQLQKLRHLTIVSLATRGTKSKVIPYSVLLEELDITNLRTLEDLIIESIYTGRVLGKIWVYCCFLLRIFRGVSKAYIFIKYFLRFLEAEIMCFSGFNKL